MPTPPRPRRFLVQVPPGMDVHALAARQGWRWRTLPGLLAGWLVAEALAPTPAATSRQPRALTPKGVTVLPTTLSRVALHGLPNDPFFPFAWHLLNTGQQGATPGIDINVTPVWGEFGGPGTRGRGLRIGIIDDGVENAHPDLFTDTATDRDWSLHLPQGAVPWEGDPKLTSDNHGTAVAGIAAAIGHNELGVVGVAPEAQVIGLRLLGGALEGTGVFLDDVEVAEALTYLAQSGAATIHIKNSSWGPSDGFHEADGPGFLAERALRWGTVHGRNGLGTLYVFSAGNGRSMGEDANLNGYANSVEVISVGAIRENGDVAPYSEPGSCLLVCAPGGADESLILHPDPAQRRDGIYTTDRTGIDGYNTNPASLNNSFTRTFTGTSAAVPVVSGVCALLLEANPHLGWRDVQEILVRTARQIQPDAPGWFTNAAGFHFHDDFGAGLVDATAAVDLARTWTNLPHFKAAEAEATTLELIPDDGTPLNVPLTLTGTQLRTEKVQVDVQLLHPRRGQLRVELVSPSGTTSVLKRPTANDAKANFQWTFATVQLWGEPADGTWTLRVIDTEEGHSGSLAHATLRVFGTSSVPDDYETWLISQFGEATVSDPAQAHRWGAAADPDGDGLPNLAEAYFGLSPLSPDPPPWHAEVTENEAQERVLLLRWTSSELDELQATVQWSPDLLHWYQGDEAPDGVARGLVVQSDGFTHTATLPLRELTTAWLRLSLGRQPSLLVTP